jgi:proteic killer suppression protein
VIRSFRSRALAALWQTGDAAKIRPDLVKRLKARLSRLDAAMRPEDMNAAGFNFHRLQGKPVRYTVYVNGPWCLTFEWDGEDAVRADLEQFH